ncbi:hypothetical protein BAUCODRAFT_36075 [Baudoinia panamericana UAMH 10762]|uniref:SWR1-complex protein 3 domain-containing protein n=1 Tax=Baudoinia panamericana (strain UAMH 10762) TaxID=717646 RepID=M2ME14_BAUPA|nr:uncharacterized protein BAUCODRAFT_36075 [Baudoinia panamericana UAMH 10762]EMC94816.1 hypothetical protein BAUCODRAFT_36075 [Baudoinia panamericana UAMH 10762]
MTQAMSPTAGLKRGPGRPPKDATPLSKKPRLSTDLGSSPALLSPIVSIPAVEKKKAQVPKLPSKVSDKRALPTLPQPQALPLSDDEYQSIAASAVLQASLARSQARWTTEGLFERYWVKPETGKNAKPPPANNPDVKWMKAKGECRIRIEPHIFECQMYVEEKPKPPPPPKQYPPPGQAGYGQPYRPQQYTPGQPYQNQALPPLQQQSHQGKTLPPINSMTQRAPSGPVTPASRAQPAQVQPEKKMPDPVISKLAARASQDPELKSLMKEVATGSATAAQLKVFQTHIDDLQKQIRVEREEKERQDAEAEKRRREADAAKEEVILYDGANDSRTGTPTPHNQQPPATQQAPFHNQPSTSSYAVQQGWTGQQSTQRPVILSFTVPGASEDRFLFPQHSILETLSPHHHLASFIVTRKGRDAADPTGLDPNKEYWQPVTIMLEVKTGLETTLPEFVKRWVKPANEVRKHMEDVMKRCERAPESWLALRLPLKDMEKEDDMSSKAVSKEASPIVLVEEKKAKVQSNVKFVKKPTSVLKKSNSATNTTAGINTPSKHGPDASTGTVAAEVSGDQAGKQGGETAPIEAETTESGRPRRAVRKSVRISEG